MIAALVRFDVDFVLVGGLAGVAHGSSYPTYDVDVAYSRDVENVRRLAAALRSVGARLRVGGVSDAEARRLPFRLDERSLQLGANFTFSSDLGSIDILADADGMRTFENLKKDSEEIEVAGSRIRVASLDDLIAMKTAANRTKDKLMVTEYITLSDVKRQRSQPRRPE